MTEIRDLGGHFLIFEQNGDPGEWEGEKGRLNIQKGGQEGPEMTARVRLEHPSSSLRSWLRQMLTRCTS